MKAKKPNPIEIEVRRDLTEYARICADISALETRREKQLKPLRDEFESKAKPIERKYADKLTPLLNRRDALVKSVTGAIEGGYGKPDFVPVVEADGAVAELSTDSKRTIDPVKFFAAVPESERTIKFWECVAVQVTKVDKAFGNRFISITDLKTTHKVNVRLK